MSGRVSYRRLRKFQLIIYGKISTCLAAFPSRDWKFAPTSEGGVRSEWEISASPLNSILKILGLVKQWNIEIYTLLFVVFLKICEVTLIDNERSICWDFKKNVPVIIGEFVLEFCWWMRWDHDVLISTVPHWFNCVPRTPNKNGEWRSVPKHRLSEMRNAIYRLAVMNGRRIFHVRKWIERQTDRFSETAKMRWSTSQQEHAD